MQNNQQLSANDNVISEYTDAVAHLLAAEKSLGTWQNEQMKLCKTVDDYMSLANKLPKGFKHAHRVYEAAVRLANATD